MNIQETARESQPNAGISSVPRETCRHISFLLFHYLIGQTWQVFSTYFSLLQKSLHYSVTHSGINQKHSVDYKYMGSYAHCPWRSRHWKGCTTCTTSFLLPKQHVYHTCECTHTWVPSTGSKKKKITSLLPLAFSRINLKRLVSWHNPVIITHGRQRQEDQEFKASVPVVPLSYIRSPNKRDKKSCSQTAECKWG